jgi:hypothetical protein
VDGNNYLYLAEDLSNLYVGLDLCSDRSTDEAMEWVGVWLVTAGRSFGDWVGWEGYLNDGAESLLYSVPDQETIPFFSTSLTTTGCYANSESEYLVISGTAQGNSTNLGNPAIEAPFNITAAYATGYHSRVDFTVNLERCFGLFTQEWIQHVKEVRILLTSYLNASIGNNNIIVWYPNNTFSLADPHQVININGGTSPVSETIHIGVGNMTAAHGIKISVMGDCPGPFKQIIDSISFVVQVNDTNRDRTGGYVYYPYSSIDTYELARSFGTSADCSASHRMFEIRIPKSQIEHYDSNGNLGIMIGGYGTLSLPGSNYWVYSTNMNTMSVHLSGNYHYFNMLGIEVPSDVPGYDLLVLAGVAGGLVAILASKRVKAIRKQ